ncbi:N-acetylmuramoyl-L-alanine amidase [Flavobacterium sp. WV_118_3]|uniref:N-acetylmuramoyl-L-alanine amidase n=1 Tax=Flavobacterium sp. WV_118_3 TaxID=3151764 RepID=UPI00321A46F2
MKIISHDFPEDQYYREVTKKKGIVLHHTVSGDSVLGDIEWWKSTAERVATPIIIARDGGIHQLYSSQYWAHHLGIKQEHFKRFELPALNTQRNKEFIGIELDSWGGLTTKNGKFYSFSGQEVKKENVTFYEKAFRGYQYFEKYTTAQIASLKELLEYWGERYAIPLSYKGPIMFEFNKRALSGESGIWAHVSFRPDKSDVHPQKELIDMLKALA